MATLSPTGKIFIYNNTGSVGVVVDVLAGSRNQQAEGVWGSPNDHHGQIQLISNRLTLR